MVMVKARKMRQHNMMVLRLRKMTDIMRCERLKQKVFVKKARDRSRSAMVSDDHSTNLPPVGKYKVNRKDNAWLNESTQASYSARNVLYCTAIAHGYNLLHQMNMT